MSRRLRRAAKRKGLSEMVGALFIIAILIVAFGFTLTMFNAFKGYQSAVDQRAQLQNQKASEQLSFNSVVFGDSTAYTPNNVVLPAGMSSSAGAGFWPISNMNFTTNADGWAFTSLYIPQGEVAYVPITLTNSQSSATAAPFQQMVTFDPATYSAYEASDLGNIRFCADKYCATTLSAWLESCATSCSPSSTSAVVWVNLPNGISGSSSVTVYLTFWGTGTHFDGNQWGEAPQLSSTYGLYDNGGNVFDLYFNGQTGTYNFRIQPGVTVSQVTGVSIDGGRATGSVLDFTGHTGNGFSAVYNTYLYNFAAYVGESNFEVQSNALNAQNGPFGFIDSDPPARNPNAIAVVQGRGSSYFSQSYVSGGTYHDGVNQQGTDSSAWLYASLTYDPNSGTWSSYIAPQLYSVAGGYSGSATTPGGLAGSYVIYYTFYDHGGSNSNTYMNWARARADPPGEVMPAQSFGGVSTVKIQGMSGLFDASTNEGSSSGPGSIYTDFTFNQGIADTEEGIGNWTAQFTLTPSEVSALQSGSSTMEFTVGDNLPAAYNSSAAGGSPTVTAYLQDASSGNAITLGFNPTPPSSGAWTVSYYTLSGGTLHTFFTSYSGGTYNLILETAITLNGQSNSAAEQRVYFDDTGIELSLTSSYSGAVCPRFALSQSPSSVRDLTASFTTSYTATVTQTVYFWNFAEGALSQVSVATVGTTATTLSVDLGQLFGQGAVEQFIQTLSGTHNISPSGCSGSISTSRGTVLMEVYAAAPSSFTGTLSSATVTDFYTDTGHVSLIISNPGTTPLHLVSLWITGPAGATQFASTLTGSSHFEAWIAPGGAVGVTISYGWSPGQYTVELVSDRGSIFTTTAAAT